MLTPQQANAMMMQQQAQAQALQTSPMGAMPVPMTGPSVYPPQFSYAAPAHAGQAFAGRGGGVVPGMVSAIPGVVSGVGLAAGIGTAGAATLGLSAPAALTALSMLDPFMAAATVGQAGFGLAGGGAAGLALGGAATLGVGALAGGAIAGLGYGAKSFAGGVGQQQALGQQLGGMHFANNMSASGRGFSFGGLHDIGKMMREFDASDAFTTMKDLNQLMDKFNQQGMAQGVQNAKQFAKKFTDYADAVKDMATTLGTTMNEAAETFGQMRGAGFYSARDVMGNTYQMSTARGRGMDNDTYLNMQAGGAATTRGLQMSGRAGAKLAANFAGMLGTAALGRDEGGLGIYDQEYLMDITGAEDLSGATSMLSQQVTGSIANFLRNTAGGNAFAASLGTVEDGRFTGKIDKNKLASLDGSGTRLTDLGRQGGRKMRGNKNLMASFEANKHRMASEIMESDEGLAALYSTLEAEAEKLGYEGDEGVQLAARQLLQMDALSAEWLVKTMKKRNAIKAKTAQALRADVAASAFQRDLAKNRSFAGLKQKITGGISDFFSPVSQWGADYESWKEQTSQDIEDWVFDIERYETSAEGQSDFSYRLASGRLGNITPVPPPMRGVNTQGTFAHGAMGLGVDPTKSYGHAFRGDTLTEEDFYGTTKRGKAEMDAINTALADPATKQTALYRIAQINLAKARGDKKAEEEAMEAFQNFIQTSVRKDHDVRKDHNVGPTYYGVNTQKILEREGNIGNIQIATGYASYQLGATKLAREVIMGDGGVERDPAAVIAEAKEKLGTAVYDSGLTGPQQEQMLIGGSGTKLIQAMKMAGKGPEDLKRLARENPDQAGSPELFAKLVRTKWGIDLPDTEIQAGREMVENLRGNRREAGEMYGNMMEPAYPASGRTLDTIWEQVAGGSLEINNTAYWLSNRQAASATLAMGSSQIRNAMGGFYSDLEDAALRGEMGDVGGNVGYRTALGNFVDKMQDAPLEGVRGGEVLVAINKRRQQANRGFEEAAEVYEGIDIDELEKRADTDKSGVVEPDELAKLTRDMAMAEVHDALVSGNTGGLFMEGQTFEGQMLYNMDLTAEKVSKMAESVDSMVETIDSSKLISVLSGPSWLPGKE